MQFSDYSKSKANHDTIHFVNTNIYWLPATKPGMVALEDNNGKWQ